MNVSVEHAVSRPLGVAQKLVGRPIDENLVYSKLVVLTGEPAILATANGRWCFLDSMMLLSRVVGHLTIVVPRGMTSLRREVENYRARAWSRRAISILDEARPELLVAAHAILCVGSAVHPGRPWTAINSNGWVARVSSGRALPTNVNRPNAMGALMAASLGVTEVFKRIFEIPEEYAPLLERTEFSLWSLTTSPADVGPPLPAGTRFVDTLLTGAGAIGNAIALLLAQLAIEGRLHIIDRQRYRDENMGTCLLMEQEGWLNEPKAIRLATWLNQHSRLAATGDQVTIETAIAENRLGGLAIEQAVNGLDDVDARRETQRLWPSVIIDGGINEVGAAVVQYRLTQADTACLRCWFETPSTDEKALQSRGTGLRRESLSNADRLLSDEDIASADESKREWLRECQRQGKTVCSIMTEAQLAALLGVSAQDGFRPSVPFVASASAALAVAAAVKANAFPHAPAPSMFQLGSLFLGPEHSACFERRPSDRCQCVTQHNAILALRERRHSSAVHD